MVVVIAYGKTVLFAELSSTSCAANSHYWLSYYNVQQCGAVWYILPFCNWLYDISELVLCLCALFLTETYMYMYRLVIYLAHWRQ